MRNAWRGRKAIGVSYTRFVPGFINLPLRIGLNPQGNSAPKFFSENLNSLSAVFSFVRTVSVKPSDTRWSKGNEWFTVRPSVRFRKKRSTSGAIADDISLD